MGAEDARPIAVASDHGGFDLKSHVLAYLADQGLEAADLGTRSRESVDYPFFAAQVARGVQAGTYRLGILVCGTGLGMSMMANRYRGVRAAVCSSAYTARMAREHNDANVLCLGGRVIGTGQAEDILRAFLDQPFAGGRHARRIACLDEDLP
ncbi:MAG: ribose 5-phosphate isomerase B [Deltaproteobacteria bacterium]|nr:ribose 5-phosphate isomerase B [Deltaproteobacteria bacterium]